MKHKEINAVGAGATKQAKLWRSYCRADAEKRIHEKQHDLVQRSWPPPQYRHQSGQERPSPSSDMTNYLVECPDATGLIILVVLIAWSCVGVFKSISAELAEKRDKPDLRMIDTAHFKVQTTAASLRVRLL